MVCWAGELELNTKNGRHPETVGWAGETVDWTVETAELAADTVETAELAVNTVVAPMSPLGNSTPWWDWSLY